MVKVSIITPVYNEEKDIVSCLKSLENQNFRDFEIIIIDDGSTDNTLKFARDFAKKYQNIRILQQNHKGPGLARNLGAKKAKGEILAFLDADMTFDKKYLRNLIKPILEDKNGKVLGTTHELEVVKNTENIWSKCWGKIRADYRKKEKDVDGTAFRAIKKKSFFEMRGFDPRFGYADDQTFWFKYRANPEIARKTICYHKNPETLKQVYKQSRWIGASVDKKIFKIPVINYISILFLVILSPIAILILSIKKCFNHKNFKIFFPWMILFISARYFGMVSGLFRRIFLKVNYK